MYVFEFFVIIEIYIIRPKYAKQSIGYISIFLSPPRHSSEYGKVQEQQNPYKAISTS